MSNRRSFLRGAGALAGAVGFAGWARARRVSATTGTVSAVDAMGVKVAPGPRLAGVAVPGARIEVLRLQMPDSVWLSASMYLPDPIPSRRIPALIKFTAYRKDDGTLEQVISQNGFFARNGYAIVRVDIRGTGASEGVATGEYSVGEIADGHLLIEWLARQPWCNGRVGIYGKSWEGCNSLQIAATQPPSLKAAAPCHASDDLYADDVHYLGGVPEILENIYAAEVMSSGIMPGGPDYDLDSPAALARFDAEPWGFQWLENQTNGPYWQRASVATDYSRLKVPMLCVTGWLDGYVNYVGRVARHAPGSVKALIGPYLHEYPWEASTGPRIDALRSHFLRWFDYWLKGEENGILREPAVTVFIPRWRRQGFRFRGDWPGDWVHLGSFPDNYLEPQDRFYLHPDRERTPGSVEASAEPLGARGRLAQLSGNASAMKMRYRPEAGLSVKSFAPTDYDGHYGLDQREDDARSLSFDSEPLRENVRILGAPRARINVSASAPVATWIVLLCDVAPDGTSYWVSRGVLNGTHRHSSENPQALTPGEVYELEIPLYATAWTFEPGHCIRVVVSNGHWPHLWPSPYPMTTMLYTGTGRASHVDLPIFRGVSAPGPSHQPPAGPDFETGVRSETRAGRELGYRYTRDLVRDEHVLVSNTDSREWAVLPHGVRQNEQMALTARLSGADPAVASLESEGVFRIETGRRSIESAVTFRIDSTRDAFSAVAKATLSEGGEVMRSRTWEKKVPRKLV
jgi:predicted acyl esterase